MKFSVDLIIIFLLKQCSSSDTLFYDLKGVSHSIMNVFWLLLTAVNCNIKMERDKLTFKKIMWLFYLKKNIWMINERKFPNLKFVSGHT